VAEQQVLRVPALQQARQAQTVQVHWAVMVAVVVDHLLHQVLQQVLAVLVVYVAVVAAVAVLRSTQVQVVLVVQADQVTPQFTVGKDLKINSSMKKLLLSPWNAVMNILLIH